jgi:pimeloyl-ACP methyl ester carboxylesterase
MVPGSFGNIDVIWEDPVVARIYRRIASFARLILFDRRGSGASDPVPLDPLPPWEAYVEEVEVVMGGGLPTSAPGSAWRTGGCTP